MKLIISSDWKTTFCHEKACASENGRCTPRSLFSVFNLKRSLVWPCSIGKITRERSRDVSPRSLGELTWECRRACLRLLKDTNKTTKDIKIDTNPTDKIHWIAGLSMPTRITEDRLLLGCNVTLGDAVGKLLGATLAVGKNVEASLGWTEMIGDAIGWLFGTGLVDGGMVGFALG